MKGLMGELINENCLDEIRRHHSLTKQFCRNYVWMIIQIELLKNVNKSEIKTLFDFCEIVRTRILIETNTKDTINELYICSLITHHIEKYIKFIRGNDNKFKFKTKEN